MITGNTMLRIANQLSGLCYMIATFALFTAGTANATAAGSQGLSLSTDDGPESGWSGSASVGILSSTMNPNEADYVFQALFSADLSHEVFMGWRAGLGIRGDKDLNNEQVNRFNSAYFRVHKSLYPTDDGFDFNLGLAYYVPVEKVELRYDTYRGSFGVTPAASYSWKTGPLTGLMVQGNVTVLRRFYRYTSTQGGFPLVKESFTASLGAGYALSSKWSLGAQFSNTRAWDFEGEPFRLEYSSTQTVNYVWSPKLSIAIGHTTGGYTFGYGGADYDIRFYDRYASKVFGSIAYSI